MATLTISFPDSFADGDGAPTHLDAARAFAASVEATHALLSTTAGSYDLVAAPVSTPGADGVPAAGLDASSVDPRDREIADLRAQLANRAPAVPAASDPEPASTTTAAPSPFGS